MCANETFNNSTISFLLLFVVTILFPEIIQFDTIIIESTIDVPSNKLEQEAITDHFDLITTADNNDHEHEHELDKTNKNDDHDDILTITQVRIEPTMISTVAATQPKEVVSYQRFGRIDKKCITYPFKCHLCGFSCRFKESLLSHFKQVHPY